MPTDNHTSVKEYNIINTKTRKKKLKKMRRLKTTFVHIIVRPLNIIKKETEKH